MLKIMFGCNIRISNALTQKILFQLFMVIVLRASQKMKSFKNLLISPVFSNLVSLLHTSIWSIDDKKLPTFGKKTNLRTY